MGTIEPSRPLKTKGRFKQRIVICGSMSFYGEMLDIQKRLAAEGVTTIVPEAESSVPLSDPEYEGFKREVSSAYLRKIRALETVAILAVNRDKHGVRDYIGPNTFAEIAVAFAHRKKIFLLQSIPEVYADELSAWGAIPLDGMLQRLVAKYRVVVAQTAIQLRLFADDDDPGE